MVSGRARKSDIYTVLTRETGVAFDTFTVRDASSGIRSWNVQHSRATPVQIPIPIKPADKPLPPLADLPPLVTTRKPIEN